MFSLASIQQTKPKHNKLTNPFDTPANCSNDNIFIVCQLVRDHNNLTQKHTMIWYRTGETGPLVSS